MKIFKVGGSVRDMLLGLPSEETDWVVVGATPEAMLALGFRLVGKDFPVFLHPITHEEYALARTEKKSRAGHKGFTCYSAPNVTLKQDLARRDLTINAIAMDDQGKIIDPYHGQRDLKRHILRHVTSAFVEDPLRVYRVARILAKLAHLEFKIADDTMQLMRDIVASGELITLSHERIWRETHKALQTQHPATYFQTLADIGALSIHFSNITTEGLAVLVAATQSQAQLSPEIYFACVCYEGTIHLPVPKVFQQLHQLAMKFHQDIVQLFTQPAEQILYVLQRTDALRRTERFMQLVTVSHLINATDHPHATPDDYQRLVTRLKQTDISDLTADYRGGELVAMIAGRRQQVITDFKNHHLSTE